MSALKTYLIRAACDWAIDQGLTPHVVVDAGVPGTHVPQAFVKDGRIVLNLHPRAVSGFALNDDGIACSARFNGRPFPLAVPVAAVLAVFAKENGQGISFPDKDSDPGVGPPGAAAPSKLPRARKKPALKVIK